MATFVAITASNSPRLKDPEGARGVLARYFWDGDLEAEIRSDRHDAQVYLAVCGYDWPGAWKVPEGVNRDDFEPDYDVDSYDGFEEFLKEVAPFLAEPLTVQSVGFENCRFPISACEWYIRPGGTTVEVSGFNHSRPEDDLPAPDHSIE